MVLSDKHRETTTYDAILNAGPPIDLLAKDFVTPIELFFVRNHAGIPQVDVDAFRLTVDGKVSKPLTLTLAEIREKFTWKTLVATMQCAGNRRKELVNYHPIDDGLAWGIEAIGTAEWGGVPLREVLEAAGADLDALHIAFLGLDKIGIGDDAPGFGGSIQMSKALSSEVMLVLEMNGEPLPLPHGGPLRVVVPGYVGARSVKWLHRITVQDEPSDNKFQQIGYKLFPPSISAETVDYAQGMMLTKLPVNSVIVRPQDRNLLRAGKVVVEGYAMSDGEHEISWIDVSADGGQTWQRADFLQAPQLWTWQLWRTEFELAQGQYELVVRAWDTAANSQPETIASVWNFKGYVNNAWHRVNVTVK